MRILVTGAGGYLGNVLCRQIIRNYGHHVVAVDNFYKGHCDELISLCNNKNFEFHYSNILHHERMKKLMSNVDAIINLAAVVGFPACDADPSNAEWVNYIAIKELLNNRPNNIPFITCSTDSVFGIVESSCDENTVPNPQTLYGKTKLAGEKVALSYENTIALRFATGMGVSPRMRANLLVNDLVYQAVTNKSLTIFEPDVYRTFINVKDMAAALMFFLYMILNGRNKYNLYCVGSDDLNFTKRQLAEKVKERTGCHVVYHEFDKDKDCRNYRPNHERLNETGFLCNWSLDNTLDELIKIVPLLRTRNPYQ